MTVKGRIFVGLSFIILFLLLVFLKVHISARNEYEKGDKALQNKNFTQAITHFNRAIHWYSPGSQAIKDSIHGLWEIGTQAEKRGDYSLALQAFRALRSSLYSARSFYTPHVDWIKKCDDRIAGILVREEVVQSSHKGGSLAKNKQDILKLLKTQTEPNIFWSFVLEIGFIGWIGSAIGFIVHVFTGQKGFATKLALGWGIFIIFFYALWVVGMLKA